MTDDLATALRMAYGCDRCGAVKGEYCKAGCACGSCQSAREKAGKPAPSTTADALKGVQLIWWSWPGDGSPIAHAFDRTNAPSLCGEAKPPVSGVTDTPPSEDQCFECSTRLVFLFHHCGLCPTIGKPCPSTCPCGFCYTHRPTQPLKETTVSTSDPARAPRDKAQPPRSAADRLQTAPTPADMTHLASLIRMAIVTREEMVRAKDTSLRDATLLGVALAAWCGGRPENVIAAVKAMYDD